MFNLLMMSFLESIGLEFTTKNFGEALLCSVAGMVGIFIVIGIIIISVSILNKSVSKKDN